MFSSIRGRMSYANVVATLALFFAMTGGALAASKYLITSTKQISPKVLKTLKGKNGANGAQGPAGSAGPAGPAGPAGAAGPAGKGEKGAAGTNGTSVASATVPASSSTCHKQGGSEFTAAEGKVTTACNGTTGFTETLPPGKTEAGTWASNEIKVEGGLTIPISFAIPLNEELPENHAFVIGEKEGEGEEHEKLPTGCKGNITKPIAEPGYLCAFTQYAFKLASLPIAFDLASQHIYAAGVTGTVLLGSGEANATIRGVWVVTAPEA